jgi:hypothetical protein
MLIKLINKFNIIYIFNQEWVMISKPVKLILKYYYKIYINFKLRS